MLAAGIYSCHMSLKIAQCSWLVLKPRWYWQKQQGKYVQNLMVSHELELEYFWSISWVCVEARGSRITADWSLPWQWPLSRHHENVLTLQWDLISPSRSVETRWLRLIQYTGDSLQDDRIQQVGTGPEKPDRVSEMRIYFNQTRGDCGKLNRCKFDFFLNEMCFMIC